MRAALLAAVVAFLMGLLMLGTLRWHGHSELQRIPRSLLMRLLPWSTHFRCNHCYGWYFYIGFDGAKSEKIRGMLEECALKRQLTTLT